MENNQFNSKVIERDIASGEELIHQQGSLIIKGRVLTGARVHVLNGGILVDPPEGATGKDRLAVEDSAHITAQNRDYRNTVVYQVDGRPEIGTYTDIGDEKGPPGIRSGVRINGDCGNDVKIHTTGGIKLNQSGGDCSFVAGRGKSEIYALRVGSAIMSGTDLQIDHIMNQTAVLTAGAVTSETIGHHAAVQAPAVRAVVIGKAAIRSSRAEATYVNTAAIFHSDNGQSVTAPFGSKPYDTGGVFETKSTMDQWRVAQEEDASSRSAPGALRAIAKQRQPTKGLAL